jgi:uncharacterized membrane protein YebE (DUF533 family)
MFAVCRANENQIDAGIFICRKWNKPLDIRRIVAADKTDEKANQPANDVTRRRLWQ